MCTVTLVPDRDEHGTGLRIACNRDESRSRGPALPPQLRRFGDRTAILPIDAETDGTWIAVNDVGLVGIVLNRNPVRKPLARTTVSRGTIVPCLLHCEDLASAERLALDLNGHCFAPFRLILASREVFTVIEGGGQANVVTEQGSMRGPRMFTSSGLGDAVVEGPRRALFDQWTKVPFSKTRQLAFHRHAWPEQPHLSVCMRRVEACTVSMTTIDLGTDTARMTYVPQAPDEPGPSFSTTLSLSVPVLS